MVKAAGDTNSLKLVKALAAAGLASGSGTYLRSRTG